MLKVKFIPHSEDNGATTLENVIQNIYEQGNDILFVTSDDRGYTIIYSVKERKSLNG